MGFFSWDCKCCEHPMLLPYVVDDTNAWMNDVVVVSQDGETMAGSYDGYGRVECDDGYELELTEIPQFSAYHRACWQVAHEPGFQGASDMSVDQGYFFDREHDVPKPESMADIERARKYTQRHSVLSDPKMPSP